MKTFLVFSALCCGLLLDTATSQCQQLMVETDAGKQVVLTRADLEGLSHVKVTVAEHSASSQFEGVALRTVLENSGISFGDSLRGKRLATCALIEGWISCGYRAARVGPSIYRQADLVGIFARRKTIGPKGWSLLDCHTRREENGALGKAGQEYKNCERAVRRSVTLDHHDAALNSFLIDLVGTMPGNGAINQIVADANDHVGHDIASSEFLLSFRELVSG